jgi:threonine synthase
VADDRYSLELFHGPTLAFKDVGARFMARLLGYFNKQEKGLVNVLVATSGDTGSAVANGFLGVEGVRVFVLYPQGKVSKIQESQFTTLGKNITAIEVNGTFDDCQALVKSAFMDEELNEKMRLTSANSINVARFLPQMFYYFHAYAQLVQRGQDVSNLVMAVPSGNFGNITAGLIGKAMGLPIKRFIAANNANDIFYKYLQTGRYEPKPSIATIANAMDVGDPSNFARVLDLYKHSHEAICKDISGCTYTDEQIADTMAETYKNEGYMLDPHGACGYRALKEGMKPGEVGVFIETAHPAKFKDTVEAIIGDEVKIPAKLKAFMKGKKQTVKMSNGFTAFKKYLMKV